MQLVESAAAPATYVPSAPLRRRSPASIRLDPRRFGRFGVVRAATPVARAVAPAPVTAPSPGWDLKLFAVTFLAGFLFVSILLA